jgi:hypothetical protein
MAISRGRTTNRFANPGGNRELREHSFGVTIAIHEADARWAESVETILDERYRGFSGDHGLTYEQDVYD